MARYTGPKFKLSRRLGISLSGTGKDLKRPFPPGQHGANQRRKVSNYGMQLLEKQKLRHMYGLGEKQFKTLFTKAQSSRVSRAKTSCSCSKAAWTTWFTVLDLLTPVQAHVSWYPMDT